MSSAKHWHDFMERESPVFAAFAGDLAVRCVWISDDERAETMRDIPALLAGTRDDTLGGLDRHLRLLLIPVIREIIAPRFDSYWLREFASYMRALPDDAPLEAVRRLAIYPAYTAACECGDTKAADAAAYASYAASNVANVATVNDATWAAITISKVACYHATTNDVRVGILRSAILKIRAERGPISEATINAAPITTPIQTLASPATCGACEAHDAGRCNRPVPAKLRDLWGDGPIPVRSALPPPPWCPDGHGGMRPDGPAFPGTCVETP